MTDRVFSIVTGASTGIGKELARICAEESHDVLICANESEIEAVSVGLNGLGDGLVIPIIADLGTEQGIAKLWQATDNRRVDHLFANAGRGLGHGFLDQELEDALDVVNVNVSGTISLIHKVGRQMRERGRGRILIVGSIAGFIPGSFQAVYNGTKAFLDSFSWALRNELKDTDITVTCLMPGPTETHFFERADMENTDVGEDDSKADPAKVARDGYDAMMKGDAGIVSGLSNKIQAALAGIVPDSILAERHRKMAEPHDM